ncbi:TPA: RluA family pseudouridine synthase, partial [Enterococcus faecium]|nr:RluA family pseudouridine synthase [Enterococcus faecium]
LHAKLLGFTHPTTGESLVFEAPLPELFADTLKKLRKND